MTDTQGGGVPSEHPPGSLAHFRAWGAVHERARYSVSAAELFTAYATAFPPPYDYGAAIADVCPPRPFIVPKSVDARTANRLYGEDYFIDWRYENDPRLPEVPPLPPGTHLSFAALRVANAARVGQFKTPNGDKAHTTDDGSDWSTLEWAGAMCGEAGEAANIAKKLRRGDFGPLRDNHGAPSKRYAQGVALLANELADTVIYADLVAKREGIDLDAAVELTWNTKSNEIGFTGRLQRGVFVAGAAVPPAPARHRPAPWESAPIERLPVSAPEATRAPNPKTSKIYSAYAQFAGLDTAPFQYVLTHPVEETRSYSTWEGVRIFLKGKAAVYVWKGRQRDNPGDAEYDSGANPSNT